MTIFSAAVTLEDAFQRKTVKTYQTVDIVDTDLGVEFLAAKAFADSLVPDLEALTEMRVLFYQLRSEFTQSDSVTLNANKDEGLTMSVEKEDNKLASITVPAPIKTIFDQSGVLDITDATTLAYIAHFVSGGGFTVSDGEIVTFLKSGRLDT